MKIFTIILLIFTISGCALINNIDTNGYESRRISPIQKVCPVKTNQFITILLPC